MPALVHQAPMPPLVRVGRNALARVSGNALVRVGRNALVPSLGNHRGLPLRCRWRMWCIVSKP